MSIATEIERIKNAKEGIINTLKANDVEIEENVTIDELDIAMKEVPILDTSDATATATDIVQGKTAYVNGKKVEGTYKGEGIDTSDATATATDILLGKTAYVKGEKVTGELNLLEEREYVELEYLEATGTQGFQIDVLPTNNIKIVVEFYASDSSNRNISHGYGFGLRMANAQYRLRYYNDGATYDTNYPVVVGEKVKLQWGQGEFYVNDVLRYSIENREFTAGNWITIFCYGNPGAYWDKGYISDFNPGRLYSYKIYENDVLIRDLIPVKRTSNSEICLYDLVTKSYYTNVGTGTFVAGPEIPPEISFITGEELSYYRKLETSYLSRINDSLGANITTLPEGIVAIDNYAFYGCSKLPTIAIPNTVREIDTYAFYNCSSLSISKLSTILEKIGTTAFRNCTNITTLDTMSLRLNKIDGHAFRGCTKLTKFIVRSISVPAMSSSVFQETPIEAGTGYIYVQDNLVSSFKSATNWSTYADQIKPISELGV